MPGNFSPVYAQGEPGAGIGGYDLPSPRIVRLRSITTAPGKLDHLALYRPGTGTIWILKNNGGNFSPVYAQGEPGAGIGGYDLLSAADRAFAFDYDSTGKLDHLVLYRPATGTIWILKNNGETSARSMLKANRAEGSAVMIYGHSLIGCLRTITLGLAT